MRTKGYFTTGEFAKLCNVEKSTLFFYDRIGLFSPDRIEDNGYRFYSAYRLEEFEMISMFRYMGMSIERIKKYIKERDPHEYIKILTENIDDVDKEMERLIQIKKSLETKISITNEGLQAELNTVGFEDADEQYYFVTSYVKEIEDTEIYRMEAEHVQRYKKLDIPCAFPTGEIYALNFEDCSDYDFKYYHTRLYEYMDIPDLWVKPAGKYIKYYHKDSYLNTPTHIQKILEYVKKNDIKINKFIYEDTLIDEMAIKTNKKINESPFLIKLTVRIIE